MKLVITLCITVLLLVIGDAPVRRDAFDGTWTLVSGQREGKPMAEAELQPSKLTLESDRYTIELPGNGIVTGMQTIDSTKSPKTIDIMDTSGINGGETCLGIYEFGGDEFRVVFAPAGMPRPTTFTTAPGDGRWMHVWKRVTQ
ncbi:MAG TPA: TIGR03067 domain-containing protein [Pirellulales bacterium]|nr:TIGR03067 domain-containing protein [Pirellulales bacterium]